jgi:exodeoxyribonuclease VII large subunit
MQELDLAADALARTTSGCLGMEKARLAALGATLREHRPDQMLAMHRHQLEGRADRLRRGFEQRLESLHKRLKHAGNLLRVLGPQATLKRGYSITRTAEGEIVRSVAQVAAGARLTTQVADGEIASRVEDGLG